VEHDDTVELLRRWSAGDKAALDQLIRENLEWMQRFVHPRIDPRWRSQVETLDIVHVGVDRLLRYGPKVPLQNRAQLQAFLGKALSHLIIDFARRVNGPEHDLRREERLPEQVDDLLGLRASITDPGQAAERAEAREWIQIALEALEPEDRQAVRLHFLDGLSLPEVAETMGLSKDALRKRLERRALPQLAEALAALRKVALDLSATWERGRNA